MTHHQLKRQLKTLQAIAPNAAWQSSRRDILLAQVRAQSALRSVNETPLSWRAKLNEYLRLVFLFTDGVVATLAARGMVVASLVVVMIFASGGYVVAASAHSYPGDRLYGLKLAVENIELKVAPSPRARVALQVEFASRRLEELSELTRRNGNNLPAAELLVSQFETNVHNAAATTTEVSANSPEKGLEIARIVDERVGQYEHTLQQTKASTQNTDLSYRVDQALSTVNRAGTGALKVIVAEDTTVGAEVADKIDNKIKNAEETLRLADAKLEGLPAGQAGGAKSTASIDNSDDEEAAEARAQSAVAKTNLAEAKKKVVEGDYKAAVAILEGVADIVDEVAATAENLNKADVEGEVKGETAGEEGAAETTNDAQEEQQVSENN